MTWNFWATLRPFILFGFIIGFVYSAATGEWTVIGSLAALALIWKILPTTEGPPVLPLAMTHQWLQVTAGMLYLALTGRKVKELNDSAGIRDMVWIGLASIIVMSLGLLAGKRLFRRSRTAEHPLGPIVRDLQFPLPPLYFGILIMSSAALALAWELPGLTQAIVAVFSLRYAFFYLILRRLAYPHFRWRPFFAYLGFEIALGATGYFASFREPVMIATLALLETCLRAGRREHWAGLAALMCMMLFLGLAWSGIKAELRVEMNRSGNWGTDISRLDSTTNKAVDWAKQGWGKIMGDADKFVSRLWSVYYPSLALRRVPSYVPHEDGKLLQKAVMHVLKPRLFFPNKPKNPSDSRMVRKYAGIFVSEKDTSIAFGYVGQSYVDFGLPLMFLPIFCVGAIMGYMYKLLLYRISHRELAIAITTVIFWSTLYIFEQSWVMFFGRAGMLLICLSSVSIVLDRYLLSFGRPAWMRMKRVRQPKALPAPIRTVVPLAR